MELLVKYINLEKSVETRKPTQVLNMPKKAKKELLTNKVGRFFWLPPFDLSTTSPWLLPHGDTDSELLFCHLLAYLEPLWSGGSIPSLERRFDVVTCFAQEVLKRGASNFLYSDGLNLFAHGHRHTIPGDGISNEPGLYVSQHDSEIGDSMNIPCQGLSTEGRCSRHALVATMPLNNNRWDPLKAGEIACFERGERIR